MDPADLQKELDSLRTEIAAAEVQRRLLENFVAMARSATHDALLKNTLQKTLEVAIELTSAEKGSLFLFDSQGAVSDSILTRSETSPGQRSELIGRVLDKGLAGWVLRNRTVGMIADTNHDHRWLALPDQPYQVRSALAVPILRQDQILGLLTLLHSEPEHFTTQSADLMEATSHQMALALASVHVYTKLDESYRDLNIAKSAADAYSKALDQELEKGRKIQRDFLPNQLPRPNGWEIAAFFQPAWQVSGDFYDAFELPGGYLGLVIADVSDKGVGAALFMALFRSLIRTYSTQALAGEITADPRDRAGLGEEPPQPDQAQAKALEAVQLTSNYLAENHGEEGMFATLFFGVLSPGNGLLAYVNAGHEPPLVIGSQGVKGALKTTGPAVGLATPADYSRKFVVLEPGDQLLGYTDGVTEARSETGALFSRQQLLDLLTTPVNSAGELIRSVKTRLDRHVAGSAQSDDITMIALRRKLPRSPA